MKFTASTVSLLLLASAAQGNEDHLVMVPTPIIMVGDGAEHTVISVPYVSGLGLDFIAYCSRIASPHMAEVRSPAKDLEKDDINFLSLAGISIEAEEKDEGNPHLVTIDFSSTPADASRSELLQIATSCIYQFGDSCMIPFRTDIALKGVPAESDLHQELEAIRTLRAAATEPATLPQQERLMRFHKAQGDAFMVPLYWLPETRETFIKHIPDHGNWVGFDAGLWSEIAKEKKLLLLKELGAQLDRMEGDKLNAFWKRFHDWELIDSQFGIITRFVDSEEAFFELAYADPALQPAFKWILDRRGPDFDVEAIGGTMASGEVASFYPHLIEHTLSIPDKQRLECFSRLFADIAADFVPSPNVELPEKYLTEQYKWAMEAKTAHERAERLAALWHRHLPRENGGEGPLAPNGYEDGTHSYVVAGCAWNLTRAYIETGQNKKALKTLNWLSMYESRLQLNPVVKPPKKDAAEKP